MTAITRTISNYLCLKSIKYHVPHMNSRYTRIEVKTENHLAVNVSTLIKSELKYRVNMADLNKD